MTDTEGEIWNPWRSAFVLSSAQVYALVQTRRNSDKA
jgi:hypothetical protein